MSVTIHDVLEGLRGTALDERDKGDKFERLVLNYLRTDRSGPRGSRTCGCGRSGPAAMVGGTPGSTSGYKAYNGAVSEGGTITRSSDESVSPVYRTGDRGAKTTWRYRDYKNTCTQKINARPDSHQGGYYLSSRSRPNYGYCKYYAPMTWSTNDAKAWTYQAGVTLWGVLNVNAQTGYSSDVTLSYKFESAGKRLCGNSANPPLAKLVAGK